MTIKIKAKSKGFTLLELMLVIAIIIIITSMLFPAISKARDKAKQLSCLNNQKQIILMAVNYSDSFNGYFLFSNYSDGSCWGKILKNGGEAYSIDTLSCPAEMTHFTEYKDNYHYGINIKTFGATPAHAQYKPQKISAVAAKGSPSLVLTFADSTPLNSNPTPNTDTAHVIMRGAVYPLDNSSFCYPINIKRHNKHANVAFLDGHASSMNYIEVKDSKIWRPSQVSGVLVP